VTFAAFRRSLCALVVALYAAAPAHGQPSPQPTLPTVKLTAGIHLITAEVADTEPTRVRGLMFRESLAPNHGMLFVFDEKAIHCMWMRNTLIPLSVAFIDDAGAIVNVADMAPRTETSHCAQRPVRFALEMERGWFAKRGLGAGSRIGGLPKP
jgi:uncharacterized membrane protein (UPF0127 family)